MKVKFEISHAELRRVVNQHLRATFGEQADIRADKLLFEVRKHDGAKVDEWERGSVRITYDGGI